MKTLPPNKSPLAIVAYDSGWPAEFARIAEVLSRALGPLALRIDHIGSTAVPGLAAKDRIDIQVTVAGADSFEPVRLALAPLGYSMAEYTGDHIPAGFPDQPELWQKRFFRPPTDQRPTNLHVRIEGLANQRYALLFRDYLRANSQAASAYAALKAQLVIYHSDDIEAYCNIKDPVCDSIMAGAEIWAKTTDWKVEKA